jgi:hypothetical protein
MRWTREYRGIWLQPEAIGKAFHFFEDLLLTEFHKRYEVRDLSTDISGAVWEYPSDEDFFAAYHPGLMNATYRKAFLDYEFMVRVMGKTTFVGIKAKNRKQMEAVFETLEALISEYSLSPSGWFLRAEPVVFIGHGESPVWKELAGYLLNQQGYAVKPYGIDAGSEKAVREVLDEPGFSKGFAVILVAESDSVSEGSRGFIDFASRDADFFRVRLGSSRVAVIVEGEMSLLGGATSGIRVFCHARGKTRESFWEVLEMLHREFGKRPPAKAGVGQPKGKP